MGCADPGCDGDDKLPYECRRCGQEFCSEHRLPESHTWGASGTHNARPQQWFPGAPTRPSRVGLEVAEGPADFDRGRRPTMSRRGKISNIRSPTATWQVPSSASAAT
ncbi:AN1-type zinc finger domain-containing protein [Halomicroarcula sp. GCM10025817]|uniref:AN1-type zinc finger domain-containing protein n=1 Tax=Haloarcula TaxID=2237 RepID=UPI0036229DA9